MNEFFYEPTVKVLMLKGEKGKGIASIEKASTSGLVDTYTVKFDDGTVSTFTVTNGKEISGISKTGTSGLVDTYTISFNDGTTSTFTVTNGEKGDKGDKGDQGIQGIQGEKGDKGDTGAGTPTGGKAGQYLKKKTDTDYDFEWSDIEDTTWDNLSGKPSTFTPTPSVTKSITLTAANWVVNSAGTNYNYTISDALITATSNQEVIPAESITAEQLNALQKANIICDGQWAGGLTLKTFGTVPTVDIPVKVIFRGTI